MHFGGVWVFPGAAGCRAGSLWAASERVVCTYCIHRHVPLSKAVSDCCRSCLEAPCTVPGFVSVGAGASDSCVCISFLWLLYRPMSWGGGEKRFEIKMFRNSSDLFGFVLLHPSPVLGLGCHPVLSSPKECGLGARTRCLRAGQWGPELCRTHS